MPANLRIALTADLHWGVRPTADEATRLMVEFLRRERPDVLVLAGDVGAGDDFARCLELFAELPCRKALVPGNHDIWVEEGDARGDSLTVYREHLPRLAAQHSFHYLDQAPLYLPEVNLAVVGSINWYDYSWSIDALRRKTKDWEERLHSKRFSRGRHNDARFVRWDLDDVGFTALAVDAVERQLAEARAQAVRAILVTHHPPCYGLSFPRLLPPLTVDALLWDAFTGNQALAEVLSGQEEFVSFAFCGHTHRERENALGKIRGYNIGGDYHYKRLLLLDWASGKVQAHQFGDPNKR